MVTESFLVCPPAYLFPHKKKEEKKKTKNNMRFEPK